MIGKSHEAHTRSALYNVLDRAIRMKHIHDLGRCVIPRSLTLLISKTLAANLHEVLILRILVSAKTTSQYGWDGMGWGKEEHTFTTFFKTFLASALSRSKSSCVSNSLSFCSRYQTSSSSSSTPSSVAD